MLHILLLILKIIGFIIAVILGILLLTVCVILFVPIRYQLTASCDGTFAGLHAKARATWLLHLVRLYVSYENRKLSWRIGIAWKSIRSGKEDKNTIKAEVKNYGKEVEELWEDFEDDLREDARDEVEDDLREDAKEELEGVLEEETHEADEEKRGISELDEERFRDESGRMVCEEKRDRSVRKLEKEWNRLMEEHDEGQKDGQKRSGEAVEKIQEEPEALLARLEQEMERILETGEVLEEGETSNPEVWEEGGEGIREEASPGSPQEQGDWQEVSEDSGEGWKVDHRNLAGEGKECREGGVEEQETAHGSSIEPEGASEKYTGERKKESLEDAGEDGQSEQEPEGAGESGDGEQKHVWQKFADCCRRMLEKITGLYRKIAGIPDKIKCTVQNICDRIETLTGKKDKILGFLKDEVHRSAFLKVKDEVFRLLRKLRPKKLQGKIRYGFEDPCLTGKVLAGFSMAYPFLGEHLEVCPDFERRILKGRFEAAGRLRVSYFVKLLWNLVWCREVRMTYRHVRKFEL